MYDSTTSIGTASINEIPNNNIESVSDHILPSSDCADIYDSTISHEFIYINKAPNTNMEDEPDDILSYFDGENIHDSSISSESENENESESEITSTYLSPQIIQLVSKKIYPLLSKYTRVNTTNQLSCQSLRVLLMISETIPRKQRFKNTRPLLFVKKVYTGSYQNNLYFIARYIYHKRCSLLVPKIITVCYICWWYS